jgi:uncharacterized protein Yka (UPF0111/DUF47 family)|tara:strand:+ start:723 stop:875 length:153 start_codon:yes stop_codon:yes gene_type:complete
MKKIKPQELFEEQEYIPIEKNDITKLIKQLDKVIEQLKIILKSLVYTRDS